MDKTYRAYSMLNTKAMQDDDDKVVLEGIASTPSPDSMLDVVEPKGARFKTPMPLLWQHNHELPIGSVTFAKAEDDGIPFVAEIPKVAEAGKLKDRIDEAIQSIKYGLVKAVSIGFRPIEYSFMDNGGVHFQEWEWYELSAVTIPANAEAVISAVKAADRPYLPAPGPVVEQAGTTPRARGSRRPIQLIPRKR